MADADSAFAGHSVLVQVESMLKHYKVPVLLIEFNPDKVCTNG